jgi:deazaflavin-dependent oxidoreductase (nitroreductase family)
MNVRDSMVDTGGKLMNVIHRTILAVSGGRILNRPFGMPAVELHTIGRKTGKERVNMLTAPINDPDRVVIVASKGGDDRDPDWYRNLVANPDIEIVIEGQSRKMRARTASSQEKAELWPRITAAYGGYAGYQERTTRDIPVVICEPRRG